MTWVKNLAWYLLYSDLNLGIHILVETNWNHNETNMVGDVNKFLSKLKSQISVILREIMLQNKIR